MDSTHHIALLIFLLVVAIVAVVCGRAVRPNTTDQSDKIKGVRDDDGSGDGCRDGGKAASRPRRRRRMDGRSVESKAGKSLSGHSTTPLRRASRLVRDKHGRRHAARKRAPRDREGVLLHRIPAGAKGFHLSPTDSGGPRVAYLCQGRRSGTLAARVGCSVDADFALQLHSFSSLLELFCLSAGHHIITFTSHHHIITFTSRVCSSSRAASVERSIQKT